MPIFKITNDSREKQEQSPQGSHVLRKHRIWIWRNGNWGCGLVLSKRYLFSRVDFQFGVYHLGWLCNTNQLTFSLKKKITVLLIPICSEIGGGLVLTSETSLKESFELFQLWNQTQPLHPGIPSLYPSSQVYLSMFPYELTELNPLCHFEFIYWSLLSSLIINLFILKIDCLLYSTCLDLCKHTGSSIFRTPIAFSQSM